MTVRAARRTSGRACSAAGSRPSIAVVTWVATSRCTSGSSASGPTVSTYAEVSVTLLEAQTPTSAPGASDERDHGGDDQQQEGAHGVSLSRVDHAVLTRGRGGAQRSASALILPSVSAMPAASSEAKVSVPPRTVLVRRTETSEMPSGASRLPVSWVPPVAVGSRV